MILVKRMSDEEEKQEWWKEIHIDDCVIIECERRFSKKVKIIEGRVNHIDTKKLGVQKEGMGWFRREILEDYTEIPYRIITRVKNLETGYDSSDDCEC